jgi:hypothetical protein
MNAIQLIKGMFYLILKAKQGGKYLSRKEIVNRKTGKKSYQYKYKPLQQRAAHEVTRNKFEKVTKLSGDEHKNQIERALQNNIPVSLHVLRDYPDLAKKYNQGHRIEQADKISARVKASKKSSQVPNSPTENKGREEKKMEMTREETLAYLKKNQEAYSKKPNQLKEGFDSNKIYEILPKYSIEELRKLDYPELRKIAGMGYRNMDKDLLKKINAAFTPLLKEGSFGYDTKESAIKDIVKYSKNVIESDKRARPHTEQEYKDTQAYRHGYGSSVMNRDY